MDTHNNNETNEEITQYLTFMLGSEQYGLNIQRVIEIFAMCDIRRIPLTPDYVQGVINLRGTIIPTVDLRKKIGLQERDYDPRTCIMVTKVTFNEDELTIGIIVDTVLEVQNFTPENICQTPNYGESVDNSFVTALGKIADGSTAILIDIDEVFSSDEKQYLQETSLDS